MKFFALDWERAFGFLEALGECKPALRRLLARVELGAVLESKSLGPDLARLLAAGILAPIHDPLRVRVADDFRGLHKLLRALERTPLAPGAGEAALPEYVSEHFTEDERYSLGGRNHGYDGGMDGIVALLTSLAHARSFLEARSCAAWEKALLERQAALARGESPVARLTREAGDDLRLLLRHLIGGPGPLRVREFPGLFPELTRASLALAVELGLRYGLLFAMLDAAAEVVLFVWPRVHTRLREGDPRPPQTTSTSETFLLAWALEDLEHLLVRAGQPLRMKASGYELFAADERELVAGLVPLPDWLVASVHTELSGESRVAEALQLARHHEFVDLHAEGRSTLLAVTELGLAWLERPVRERLAAFLAPLRATHVQAERARPAPRAAFDFRHPFEPERRKYDGLARCFEGLAPGQPVEVADFLRYHVATAGVSLEEFRDTHGYRVQSEQELEQKLARQLVTVLFEQLLPWGGARAGLSPRRTLTFELTPVGRYILGLAPDFALEAAAGDERPLRVQPDFEVVFVAANPRLEARLARFAERRGRGVGVLFRITRDSIQAAARARLTADDVLGTLGAASATALPANVVHEIRGWFARCRHVDLEPVQLLRCPDAETARRVLTLAGARVEPVSETVLALRDPKQKAELVRLCAKHGLFLGARRTPRSD